MDGPATQYRQKANYFYLSSEPYIWRSPVLVLKLGMGWGTDGGGGLKRSGQVVEQGEVTPDGQRLNEKLNKGSFSISQRMLLNEGLR